MGYNCCVPGCRTGYKRKKGEPEKSPVPCYRFPSDPSMQARWIRAIASEGLVASHGRRVCQLHFSDDDFQQFSSDKQSRRKKHHGGAKLSRPRLKPTAVPHIFPTLQTYPTSSNPRPLNNSISLSARLSSEDAHREECKAEFVQQECVDDLNSLKEKFLNELPPAGYIISADNETLQFHLITSTIDINHPPMLKASVIVLNDMRIHSFIKGSPVPPSVYDDLLGASYIQTTSELKNILDRCKSLSSDDENSTHIDFALSLLEKYITVQVPSKQSEVFRSDSLLNN